MKKIILKALLVIMLVVCMPTKNCFANENTITEEEAIDKIYTDAYSIEDETIENDDTDYFAYKYMLKNKDYVRVNKFGIVIKSQIYDGLTEEEKNTLEQFVKKINTLIQLDAISVNKNLEIQAVTKCHEDKLLEIEDKLNINVAEYNLMPLCKTHAKELKKVYDNALFGTKTLTAGQYFAARVKSGGVWDLKRGLGKDTRYKIKNWGAVMTGETIGNFHYGYVGSAVFDANTLKTAAGLYQIYSGTSDMKYYKSYFDDPSDSEDIQWGIDKYNADN